MDAWLAENPPARTTIVLERALAARGWAARVPGAAAKAAITVDGTRRELDVRPDAAATLTLTPAQAAGATVEPVSGRVLVVTTRSVPLEPVQPHSGTRPGPDADRRAGAADRRDRHGHRHVPRHAGAGRPQRVLAADRRRAVRAGARSTARRVYDEGPATGPTWVDGQRVEFCVQRDPKHAVQVMRYVARVVDPGTYAWEPAVLQSSIVPDQGLATPAGTLVISAFGS